MGKSLDKKFGKINQDILYEMASSLGHQIYVLHRWLWHLALHTPFLETSEGQPLLEHQGQLLSHQEEGPRKQWSQTILHFGIWEWGKNGKKRKEGKKEKGKSLRYIILKNLHLVRWWVLKDGNTLNGLRRPIQICTRLLWPSDTLCILHDRLISSTYITKETIYVMTVQTMVQLRMVCGLCICLLLILATLRPSWHWYLKCLWFTCNYQCPRNCSISIQNLIILLHIIRSLTIILL